MRIFRFGLLAAAALALAGCSMFETKKEQPPCPRVSVLADAATLTRFKPGTGRDLTDIDLEASFASYHGTCNFDWDTRVMTITMQVGIDGRLGPAAKQRKADIGYFVAIPTFYPDPKAKLVVPVSLAFAEGTDRVRYVDDEVNIAFPIKDLRDLAKYEVFVGLQLLPDEVEYNRKLRHVE